MNEPTLTLPFFNASGGYPPSPPSTSFPDSYDYINPNGLDTEAGPSRPSQNHNHIPSQTNYDLSSLYSHHFLNSSAGTSSIPNRAFTDSQRQSSAMGSPVSFHSPTLLSPTTFPPAVYPQPHHSWAASTHNVTPSQASQASQISQMPQIHLSGSQTGSLEPQEGEFEDLVDIRDLSEDQEQQENDGQDQGHGAEEVGSHNGQDGGDGEVNEEPLYVNAKQYHRIIKRRTARQRLEELNRLARSRKVSGHPISSRTSSCLNWN